MDTLTNDDLYLYLVNTLVKERVKLRGFFGHRYDFLLDYNDDQLVDWAKNNLYPICPQISEFIPRDFWDIEGLQGATEKQLLHPHYTSAKQWLLQNYVPKSNVALLMLCSIKKPYFTNSQLKQYVNLCEQNHVDMFIISNPGVIPIECSNYYPFRWYNWPEEEETTEIKQVYINVTKQRIEEWFNHFTEYKKIISIIRPGETSQAFTKCNLKQDRVEILEKYKQEIYDEYAPRFKGYAGWERSRIINLKLVKNKFIEEVKNVG